MKKLLLLLLVLTSITLNAEWLTGTLTFRDNTVITGYIKYFNKANAGKIKFKATLNDKSVSYSSDKLKVIEMVLQNRGKIKLMRLHTANFRGFKPKIIVKKGYLWFSVIYDGDFQVLSVSITESNYAFGYNHYSTMVQYYIHWPENDYAVLTSLVGKGTTFVIGNKKFIRMTNSFLFKGKCDKMTKALDDRSFDPVSIDDVVDYYEKNCGSNIELK